MKLPFTSHFQVLIQIFIYKSLIKLKSFTFHMQLVSHYELLMAYQWNKRWWHFIEIRWKDVCNIHSYSVPNKVKCVKNTTKCNTECFVGIIPLSVCDKPLLAALCGCRESTAASCGLSMNSLPAQCGSSTAFNEYVMLMLCNFLLHHISKFWYKSLYISHWWDSGHLHFTCN